MKYKGKKRKTEVEKNFRDYNEHNSMGIMASLKLGLWDVRILDSNPGFTFYLSN